VTDKLLPITCPLCGRKNEFPVEILTEGYVLQCPQCNVKLTLHGHMLEEIRNDIARLEQDN
jgi:DNA-directed RNA polymerase subunit RPC12/RpoP